MTPEQREELKAAALAATPGPWEATRQTDDECSFAGYFIEGPNKTISDDGTAPDANDALYIAAANPAAILSLIAQVEALTVPQWQPIETMPFGEFVLCTGPFGYEGWRIKMGEKSRESGKIKLLGASWPPQLWMPLPAAPTIPAIPGTKEGA